MLRGGEQDGPGAEAVAAPSGPEFYQAARTALSPLIVHAGELPAGLRAAIEDAPEPALAARAESWVEDLATARDLVSRLAPPAGPAGAHVKQSYETAAMLQAEAARALVMATRQEPGRQQSAARTGYRLHLLGERLFDSAFRLLNDQQALRAGQLVLPARIPDFTVNGSDPDRPAAAIGAERVDSGPQRLVADWFGEHEAELARAVGILRATSGEYGATAPDQVERARALGAAARSVMRSLPHSTAGQEGGTALALAMLAAAESLRPLPGASSVAAAELALRLRLIAERLWDSGLTLLEQDPTIPGGVRGVLGLPTPAAAQDLLWTGGVFDGNPPPLRPGEDPGAGVPGGLPALDPNQILLGTG